MYFEGKLLQNLLLADKNELRSFSAVDIQGHQRGGFCIVPGIVVTAHDYLSIVTCLGPTLLLSSSYFLSDH